MVEQSHILQAFVKLGKLLREFCENGKKINSQDHDLLREAVAKAKHQNAWFTENNILFALKNWGAVLRAEKLTAWLSPYHTSENNSQKRIAIIMAGNIPLVGFHDFLSVLLTGNKAICKLSSNDTVLLPHIAEYLTIIEPSLQERIIFTEGKLIDFDAVIATGSNNTSRYFEYYFGKKPNIIRKNRSSVAVLSGKESREQLEALGEDIFRYFGLGCRNVSKIFVPNDYDFDHFFNAIFGYKTVLDHHKYANNYNYNKAVYLMSSFKLLDNGFLILKEDEGLHSPISVLFYEKFDSIEKLTSRIQSDRENLQCVVSDLGILGEIPYGQTQMPALNDYADGVDTVNFLLKL